MLFDIGKSYNSLFYKLFVMKAFVALSLVVLLVAGGILGGIGMRGTANAQEAPPSSLERFRRDRDKPHKDDEIIVALKPAASRRAIQELAARYEARIRRQNRALGTYLLRLDRGTAEDVLPLLLNEPQVEWAELNFWVSGELTPLDPDYADPSKVYAPQRIRAPEGWDVTTGSPAVVVAVVDSGISLTHPEFAGRLLPGYDFVNEDNDPTDDHGHGTHVAGILAAAMNNGLGSTGIAPGVSLLPVKVLNASNFGTWADIADGITYAADRGAQIINLSLGGPVYSQALANAIAYAAGRGAIIVTAAGNAFNSNPFYPA
jgi:thermitase